MTDWMSVLYKERNESRMNKKRIDAAVRKRKHQKRFEVWWNKNGYKVGRIFLWFIWIPTVIGERIQENKKSRFIENPIETKRWLDKVFPKMVAHYCTDEDNTILIMLGRDYEDYGDFSSESFTHSPAINKRTQRYFRLLTPKQREKMIIDYEIYGYNKILISNWQEWDKVTNMFNWYPNQHKDYCRAVIFYDESKYPTFDEV